MESTFNPKHVERPDPVRIALIGPGSMGAKYLRMLTQGNIPGACVTAVVARGAESRERVRAVCGDGVALFDSEDALYAHGDLFDAVVITTPHALHPAMALRAMEAGKHVLVDKPIGVSMLQCRELLSRAGESDRVFSVIFHQRVYPKYRRVKELLDSGALGRLCRASMENSRYLRTAHYHRSSPWRSSWNGEGGGALINQGQHLLDMWQWLFGMPETVSAQVEFGKYNDFRVDDEATLFLRYPDGMTGTFFLTTGEGTWTERLEIAGSRGAVLLDRDTLTLRQYDRDLEEYRANAQVNAREELHETVTTWELPLEGETHNVILEGFTRAIREGTPPLVEGRQGANALELMNAAYLSAWLGHPVPLPLDAEEYETQLEQRRKEERGEC